MVHKLEVDYGGESLTTAQQQAVAYLEIRTLISTPATVCSDHIPSLIS